jgi:cyanosortase A-associated protein
MNVRSRPLLLSLVGLSLILTAGKGAIAPSLRAYTPMTFPQTLEIPDWSAIGTTALMTQTKSSARYDQVLSGQSYEYTRHSTQIRIELRALFTTTGDITNFFETQTKLKLESLDFKDYTSNLGSYRVFTAQNQTYLSSCIDANGKASITPEQFRSNRYQDDWKGDRLLHWAIGQRSLLEYRCLWVLISTPATQPELASAAVQQVWRDTEPQWRSLVLRSN